MKDKIKIHVGNLHLYILAGLVLLFFGVLFLSTAFKNKLNKKQPITVDNLCVCTI